MSNRYRHVMSGLPRPSTPSLFDPIAQCKSQSINNTYLAGVGQENGSAAGMLFKIRGYIVHVPLEHDITRLACVMFRDLCSVHGDK